MTDYSSWVTPAQWHQALVGLENKSNPWPGPRPLREEDAQDQLLVGREEDLDHFLDQMQASRMLHLTGVSGVGKSSMLMAGIVPHLRQMGYLVAHCRDWDIPDDVPFLTFVAQALHRSLSAEEQSRFTPDQNEIFFELDDLGGSGVMILDQFEEFMRKDVDRRDEAIQALLELHHACPSLTVVLSYRSEYLHWIFEPLDRQQNLFRNKKLQLEPVKPAAALQLILHPRKPADAAPDWSVEKLIDPRVAVRIHELWLDACSSVSLDQVPIGLLHLQALLYVLAHESRGDRIEGEDLDQIETEAHAELGPTARELMRYSLQKAAEVRMRRAQEAADACAMDVYAVRGIAMYVARCMPHLNSGGFKLERLTSELAEIVLHDEIESAIRIMDEHFAEDDEPEKDLIAAVLHVLTQNGFSDDFDDYESLLGADRAQIVREADKALGWGEELWLEMLAATDEMSNAGPLMGLSPLAMAIEQLRRFAWAMIWLFHLDLARISITSFGRATVTLVHDGWGEALDRWSDDYVESQATWALYALATPEGDKHYWGGPRHRRSRRAPSFQRELSGTPRQLALHINLGFGGNTVYDARLSNAVFANCDFRSASFVNCRFDGVTFLNCRLDGAMFSDCEIHGDGVDGESLSLPQGARPSHGGFAELRTPPIYTLAGAEPQELAVILARYRELTRQDGHLIDAKRLLCQPPGNPAVPIDRSSTEEVWVPAAQGLVIQGSRVASLTMRRTRFSEGRLLFRRVRGSGIDIGECNDETYLDFERSLLRHVSVSAHALNEQRKRQRKQEADRPLLIVRMDNCVAAQWWIGDGFRGSLDASASSIGHLWVEPSEVFTTTLDESCTASGIFADSDVCAAPLGARDVAPQGTNDGALGDFLESVDSMDYRRRAEVVPKVRRARSKND